MKTPAQIAESVLPLGALQGIGYQDYYRYALRGVKATLKAVTIDVRGSQPIPGIRPHRLATVDELIDAYAEFDGDVSVFVDAWNDYTAGKDFACPESGDGIHQSIEGSCDLCGDKNRG